MTKGRRSRADPAPLGRAFAELSAPPSGDTLSPTRQRIQRAAGAVFGESGFAGATTRELARRAGVTEKTLFQHFGSKAEIFAAAVAPGLNGLFGTNVLSGVSETLAWEATLEDKLIALVRNRIDFARRAPALMKTVVQEALLNADFREALKSYWAQELLPGMRGMLSAAVKDGTLSDVPPDRVIRIFVSMVIGYLLTRHVLLPEHEWDDDEELRGIVDVLLWGVAPRDSSR